MLHRQECCHTAVYAVCKRRRVDEEKNEQCNHTKTWKIRGRMNQIGPTVMRGKVGLQEPALIVMNVRPELAITGYLLSNTALAPFGYEEIVI